MTNKLLLRLSGFFIVVTLCLSTAQAFAQTEKSNEKDTESKSDFFSTHKAPALSNQDTANILGHQLSAQDQKEADAVSLQHLQFTEAHQQRTFMWQYYSGIFLFIMVVAIVTMGLFLSFKQFQLTAEQVRYNLKTSKEERVVIEGGGSTSMEISQTGMKINTAVIGLAILFLSLAFFFLYLKYVYVIQVVDTGS